MSSPQSFKPISDQPSSVNKEMPDANEIINNESLIQQQLQGSDEKKQFASNNPVDINSNFLTPQLKFPKLEQKKVQQQVTIKSCRSIPAKRQKKAGVICNFIQKVYNMLQQKEHQQTVDWVEKPAGNSSFYGIIKSTSDFGAQQRQSSASSFQILDIAKFEEIVLPKYFKHSNIASFIRQLNMYGFHKLRGQKGDYQFQHDKFIRGRLDLIGEIRRKQPDLMGMSSTNVDGQMKTKKQIDWNKKLISQGNISLQNPTNSLGQNNVLNIGNSNQSKKKNVTFKQDKASSGIFPSQQFLNNQKYENVESLSNSNDKSKASPEVLEKMRQKRIQQLQEENSLLKKIKQAKTQRIRQLNSIPKSVIELKFSKVMFSFFAQKLKAQNSKVKQENGLKQKNLKSNATQNTTLSNLDEIIQHVFSQEQELGFKQYQRSIKKIISQAVFQ